MKKTANIFKGDKAIWVIFFLLSGISLLSVYSSIGLSAIVDSGSTPMHMFFKHLGLVAITYAVIITISNINYRIFSKISPWLYFGSIALLITVLAIGGERWISIPGLPSFQPSEIAKIALIIFSARILSIRSDKISELSTFILLLAVISVVTILILPENFSTAALVFLSCYVMLLFGGINKKYWTLTFLVILGVVIIALFIFYKFGDSISVFRSSTWGHRIQEWLHPDREALTQGNMAKMAIARGGFFGAGIGNTIHARLMTQAHNDFIYAIIIEEMGMWVGLLIFMLYVTFYMRCIRIANKCEGRFGALTVSGMGTVILFQALVNMCVAVGVLPITGQTLPFISYGGTAYIFLGTGIGVIQAIAYDNNITEKKRKRQAEKESIARREWNEIQNVDNNNDTVDNTEANMANTI